MQRAESKEQWAADGLTFTKVGSDCIDFRLLSDEAHSCLLVPVYATFSRT